ncbi:ATP-binding protein [Paenibacillus larvae]|nr:ATP-binding protein [Paenibacillus larvae]MDT2258799.1 ATP-binding protein [Paenibacillus larvae]MDT2262886.1 ATP-binding protein [Paenibacillus larvae]MDT2286807.1 ATP-binding protein [Paenibacillus larvae]
MDLLPLIHSTISSLSFTFHRNIELRGIPEEKAILIEANPEKIRQLLIIVLDNAIKYSQKEIIFEVLTGERHIMLRVKDQGIGIAKEDLPIYSTVSTGPIKPEAAKAEVPDSGSL